MGILEMIEIFERDYYPLSEAKKELLLSSSRLVTLQCLSDMAAWKNSGGSLTW
jgi:gp20